MSISLVSLHRAILSGLLVVCGLSFAAIVAIDASHSANASLGAVLAVALISATLILAGVSYFRSWRLFLPLGCLTGLGFVLYALAVLSIGFEDVGGANVAVLLSVACGAFGVWLFVAVAINAARHTPDQGV